MLRARLGLVAIPLATSRRICTSVHIGQQQWGTGRSCGGVPAGVRLPAGTRVGARDRCMNEAETRAEHIDPALTAAGWGVVEGSRIRREYPITPGRLEGHGRRGKPLIADYVLVYRNTKLAVVEAKAWDEQLTEGVGQAKNYAGKLAIRFTYSTNGQGIYGIDMQDGHGRRGAALSRRPTNCGT